MSVRGDDTTDGGHALQQMLFGHPHRAATIDLNWGDPVIRAAKARKEIGLRAARKNRGGRSRPKLATPGLLGCADLEDRPRARELNQRTVRRIDKTGRAAGAAAGVPHRAVIDDIGAPVWPEPQIGRAVERGRIGRADERLVAGIVAGKILEAELRRQVLCAPSTKWPAA